MDQRERLAAVVKDLINDRNEQAQVTLHDYLVQKMRDISGFEKSDSDDTLDESADVLDMDQKLKMLNEVRTVELSAQALKALQRLVDMNVLEALPKFQPAEGGWMRLMNSSLLVDERSDEGAARKSAIKAALQSAGYEVDWKSNIFMAKPKTSA